MTSDHFQNELTVLIPCLNESETIAACIQAAIEGAKQAEVDGFEILIVDNGSIDSTAEIAVAEGARVIQEETKGYGAALRAGLLAATGKYVIMGDGDGSYDFSQLSPFIKWLRDGSEVVIGTRLRGEIKPGAMPFLNQYIGNPILTLIGNILFKVGISDFHCGMRGFDRQAVLGLQLASRGMEFASEMVIRARLSSLKISEVPITYSPDGRSRPPHLRPWRDGWRHLRFMLLYSPRWVFIYPGLGLFLAGGAFSAVLLIRPVSVGSIVLDVHTLLGTVTAMIAGSLLLTLGVFSRLYATRAGVLPSSPRLERVLENLSLEVGLALGIVLIAIGGSLYVYGLAKWSERQFGPILEPQPTLRIVIAGTASALLGLEMFFSSFVFSLLSGGPETDEPAIEWAAATEEPSIEEN